MKQVLIAAGEPSGDSHAAFVAAQLAGDGDITLRGVGGPRLAAAGATIDHSIDRLSVMGTAEIVSSIPRHLAILKRLERELRAGAYDLVILVDYPDFNLRVARVAHAHGVPVLYYVAPQVWAWRPRRIKAIRRYVTHLAVILPFEKDFFAGRGIRSSFVGHPVLDWPRAERHAARHALGLEPDRLTVGLFPGSRQQEVDRMWPLFREGAQTLRAANPDIQLVLSRVDGLGYPGKDEVDAHTACPHDAMAAADVVLSKSGTTTLHAAVTGRPMIIAHKTHPLTYLAGRRLARVDSIGLVNLVAGRPIVPELLQGAATPGALAAGLARLIPADGPTASRQIEGLGEVAELLGEPGAGRRVAAIARELLN